MGRGKHDFEVPILSPGEGKIPLFMPHVPPNAGNEVMDTLSSRWLGQGPKVDAFEAEFSRRFAEGREALAVGSGTDALHLAYLMAGISEGDEVLVPLFTCTATNIPLLYMGAVPVFVDVEPGTLNMSVEDARNRISDRTKAIICVHYGGLPCDLTGLHELADEYGIPVIEDAAHALGASFQGVPIGAYSQFTMFSFQAIKHITTGDGGMLTLMDANQRNLGESLRWFGIDRAKKQAGAWENDITDVGYKYQMTDIAAGMGLAALEDWDSNIALRKSLLEQYLVDLDGISGLEVLSKPIEGRGHAAWLMTVSVENRRGLQRKLLEHGIEANQVHYRNDRYSIFGGRRRDFPMMDLLEPNYLVLPMHTRMSTQDVTRIAQVVRSGW